MWLLVVVVVVVRRIGTIAQRDVCSALGTLGGDASQPVKA